MGGTLIAPPMLPPALTGCRPLASRNTLPMETPSWDSFF